MKLKFLTGLAFLVSFLAAAQTEAQRKRDDVNGSQVENIGDRIGSEIERLVDRMTRRWSNPALDSDFTDQDTVPKRVRRAVDMEDLESESNTVTYSRETTVADSEVVNGNIVVKGADLTVAGKVDGDVLVVGGNLRIKNKGLITGNARVINGDIIKEEGAVIEGFEDRGGPSTAGYREPRRRFSQRSTSFDVPWLTEPSSYENVVFRYNRVEGLFLGLGTEKKYYWDGFRHWNAYGSVGYGFKAHKWRGNLGMTRQFSLRNTDGYELLEIGAEGYSLTDSKDQWIIQSMENTLAALLIHEDYRDYFQREGFTAHAAYYTIQGYFKAEAKVAYLVDRYDSLSNRVDWALFGGDKTFRRNPAIQPGRMRSVMASIGLNTVTKTAFGQEGWSVYGTAEFAKKSYGGDYDFDQYVLDLRRFQPLGRYENINIRLRGGTASGLLPQQKAYELGGFGTLSAFPFKSEAGNRMLLVNTEFIVNGSFLDDLDFWPTWLFRHFNFLLLSDAGFTRSVESKLGPTEGFNGVTWGEFRHNFGVGLTNRSGSFRIGVAWRTDVPAPVQFVFRINRPF